MGRRLIDSVKRIQIVGGRWKGLFPGMALAVFLTACAVPQSADPTSIPTSTPAPTHIIAPTSTPAPAASTSTPESVSGPIEEDIPPTPAASLNQAVRALEPHALLYTPPDRFLRLTDPDLKTPLWLTADRRACDRTNTAYSQSGLWSADGRFLAITCQEDNSNKPGTALTELLVVSLLDTTTGTIRRLDVGTDDTRKIRVDAQARVWSPVDPQLLVVLSRNEPAGASTIWVVANLLDDRLTQLLELKDSIADDVAWSSDGRQVAILARQVGPASLYIAHADGSDVTSLALDESDSFYGFSGPLAWSHDRRYLFLNRQHSTEPGMYTYQALRVEIASGATTVLASNLANPFETRWSPDGAWYLAGERANPGAGQIIWSLYRADGTLERTYSSDPVRSVGRVAWLPDSRRFIITANRENFGVEVILADTSGAEQVIAIYPGAQAGEIAISSDGRLLAIVLSGFRITILETNGTPHATFDGQFYGWRPGSGR